MRILLCICFAICVVATAHAADELPIEAIRHNVEYSRNNLADGVKAMQREVQAAEKTYAALRREPVRRNGEGAFKTSKEKDELLAKMRRYIDLLKDETDALEAGKGCYIRAWESADKDVGDILRARYDVSFKVFQVVNEDVAIVEYGKKRYWLETNTAGLTDSDTIKSPELIYVAGTKTYRTALGGSNTIQVLRPVNAAKLRKQIDEYLRK